jgi:hypothetical protein
VHEKIIDVPMELPGLVIDQTTVASHSRCDASSGASDIDVIAGRESHLSERPDYDANRAV